MTLPYDVANSLIMQYAYAYTYTIDAPFPRPLEISTRINAPWVVDFFTRHLPGP